MKKILTIVLLIFIASMPSGRQTMDEIPNVKILFSLQNGLVTQSTVQDFFKSFVKGRPPVHCEITYVSSDVEAMLKIVNSQNTGKKYDIAFMGPDNLYSLLERNAIIPLDKNVYRQKGLEFIEGFKPFTMGNAVYNGHLWSIPIFRTATVLFYRQNTPEFALLPNHTSLPDVLEACDNYTKRTGRTALKAPITSMMEQYVAYASPFSLRDTKKITGSYLSINTPDKTSMVAKVGHSLADKSILSYDADSLEWCDAFLQGKVPMLICTSNKYDQIVRGAGDQKIGKKVLYLDSDITFPTQGINLYVLKSKDNSDYSKVFDFTDWMTDDYSISSFAVQAQGLPLKKLFNMFPEMNYYISADPVFRSISDCDYNSFSSLCVYQNSRIVRSIDTMLENALLPNVDVKSIMSGEQKHINSVLDPYNGVISVG